MKPTVGRIVHFIQTEGRPPLAALVNAVDEKNGTVDLQVSFARPDTQRVEFKNNVKEGTKPGEWCWPPKV